MAYNNQKCYWCGVDLPKRAFSSFATDTIRTERNFCCPEHLKEFRKHAKGRPMHMILPPYQGDK